MRFTGQLGLFFLSLSVSINAEEFTTHSFDRQQLTKEYFSEGANAADVNGDSVPDVVYGPYWFAGPEFKTKHEIYEPKPQDRNAYADNFFNWIYDFNGDGRNDVLVVGFPGTPAYVYENPGQDGFDSHWPQHEVFDWVSNESPQFTNLVGDERPELVCTRDGFFGFLTIDWDRPFKTWTFHPISEQMTAKRFGHGLGIGDVNGDGRRDILHSKGWFEQPLTHQLTSRWIPHEVSFSEGYGGAEMYAYDVDGDGDNDVITGHRAHEFGLGWYEQVSTDNNSTEPSFKHHLIMGQHPSENKYGIVFSELHSIALADMDGDGLKDIVTGKTYWSHHKQSPQWDAGAVVYWFKLVRNKDGVDWVPYLADDQSGIGRQISIVDVNQDKQPDIVVGGMLGANVLRQETQSVSQDEFAAAQPKIYTGPKLTKVSHGKTLRGPSSKIDPRTSLVADAIEGETLTAQPTRGNARPQAMSSFPDDQWSNNSHLWWTGAQPGEKLSVDLPEFTGTVEIEVVLTCARDYGIVQLSIDDKLLGPPIDLYNPEVITTGVLSFPKTSVEGKRHRFNVQLLGANPKAAKAYMFGIDYLRIKKSDDSYVVGKRVDASPTNAATGIKPKSADGRELNLDFETGTLADWTADGNAWEGQPIKGDTVFARRSDMRSRHQGDYWIGGFEKFGDERVGTLTSTPFLVTDRYATFLMSGGDGEDTRVELVRKDTGKSFYKVVGQNNESLRQITVDLRPHMGQEIMIRLVDNHRGGWGHVNFDHFRLHNQRPADITPVSIVLSPDEYPYAGLSAVEAAAAMKLPDGFSVAVGAAEPDVQQPIAMAIDDRGRVWIAEAYEYPIRAKGDLGRDRILIFEDTDGDGSLDRRKVFMEGLNLVSGLEVGFGGVWVGAAPYLMFIPDRNGDDIPDSKPEILLDGWGYQDTHETLNAFIWGPDGWLYGCHGVFTHSRVGKPGTPDDERTPLNCAVWRYHPLRHEFDVFAHGTSNPWGVDFNDHGQAFITACVIPHLYHIIQGARYQRQGGHHFNPHTYSDIPTIADHLHYLGATPHSGNSKSDAAGGGHAHAGAMVYLGGRWPKQYRNQIFMNNIHGQRLNMDILKPNGSGYIGSHGPDFLLTGDKASQILNLRYGPDGNAWMIDWYDMQACHRREANLHDRTNGRIYKICYGPSETSKPEQPLASMSNLELAQLVLQQNDWYVRHSRRILQERAAVGTIDSKTMVFFANILANHQEDTRRLRAAWALHVIGSLSDEQYETMFHDPSPYIRGWALQLALENIDQRSDKTFAAVPESLLARMIELASQDESQVVRRYLASAAQKLPLNQRWDLLAALMSHAEDADDHNLGLMYWYAAEPLADEDTERALALAISAGENIPRVREFMLRRIGSSGADSALAALVRGLENAATSDLQLTYLQAIRSALIGQRRAKAPRDWQQVSKRLLTSNNEDVRLQTTALGVTFGDPAAFAVMRLRIEDDTANVETRLVALNSLLDAGDPGFVPSLCRLLSASDPLKDAAIQGLAQYEDPKIATSLLEAYPNLKPDQRRKALGTLCSRVTTGVALLRAIEAKQISGTDLTADLVRQLQFFEDQKIDSLLKTVWGTVRETAADKLKRIANIKTLIASEQDPPADQELGRSVFAKTCMKCHILYGVGNKIGPDLTGSNRANIDYLLSNIVDPSSVMAKEYRPTVIATTDGRVVNGLIKNEDAKSITLQTADAVVIIPKNEIEERAESQKSMMPDGQLKQLKPHEVRSLIAYLQGKKQVPMLANAGNATSVFNGRDLTGWNGTQGLWSVENGELVGRTDGLKQNEWIVSDLSVEDFRLSLEVLLVDNAGNSGIQFRSRAHDHEVSGYQADIGAGWWGKLYEEHGRGLLWDKSGEQHVKPGQWNTYEIIANDHQIQTRINGQKCVDLNDPDGAHRGIIAFQIHSGGKTEVRFRNINLEILAED
ncbi:PVC-type heme-binding CxxCH protein [Thalassoroseus pseudoceratinae]|uniref:PVC-type heme-binding CxxCH protein n=1 Tax=Thalassoroseus pseudoceratinae TaxID=2713176 RepID=UPI001980CD5A|nr:PVC-type heme-binding CxxCH protein [Thalassoroseus pseudoceratinae]